MRTALLDNAVRVAILVFAAALPAAAAGGHVVTINSNKVTIIDGREVFPIGFTLGPPPGGKTPDGKDGMREIADAGGLFMRTGVSRTNWDDAAIENEQKVEDAAASAGLLCWINLRDLGEIGKKDSKKEALLRKVVERFKDHPGFGFWKSVDEPEWGKTKIPPMVRARNIIRELDTNHPIILMQAPRGTVKTLKPYNVAGDVIGADIYPIGYPPGMNSLLSNKEISMVGDYTRRMMEVSEGKLPVWMVLQIAWSGVVNEGKTLRFPTFPEERFMTYDAIINGARGLVYFGGNVKQAMSPEDAALGWNWHFWNRVLRPVIEEIGTHSPLAPALVAPDSKLPIKVNKGSGIEFCAREVGADLYLLACKREGATAQAEFSNLPAACGEGELMFESPRKVEAKGGKFKDWFAPFEVHVYHFANVLKSGR